MLYALYQTTNFVSKLLYIFTDFSSPTAVMLLTGIRYSRREPSKASNLLTPLATLIYALRFIQWWREQGIQSVDKRDTIPSAPVDFPPHHKFGLLDVPGKCAICCSVPTKPAALGTGRIYCEACLQENPIYKNSSKCPVTLESVKGYRLVFLDSQSQV